MVLEGLGGKLEREQVIGELDETNREGNIYSCFSDAPDVYNDAKKTAASHLS